MVQTFFSNLLLCLSTVYGILCHIKVLHFYIVKYIQLLFYGFWFLDLIKMDALLNMIVQLVHLDFSSERFLWFIFYVQVFTPLEFIFVFDQR